MALPKGKQLVWSGISSVVLIVQGPFCLDAYRVLSALTTHRQLVLCDPGQITALLWASESSSVSTKFEDLLRDLLSHYLVDPAEEHRNLSREVELGAQDSIVWSRCPWESCLFS